MKVSLGEVFRIIENQKIVLETMEALDSIPHFKEFIDGGKIVLKNLERNLKEEFGLIDELKEVKE